ncbi:unnamed protein product [Gongylonema pulchrum]|uniref:Apple domain-containing protein n=1 Tax=Gongylonema pulchrum TaxID=637853 RepID=A0A183DHD6_9BILA|nr:unnamed protein product [Gongylonema pulchrum]
MSGPGLARSSAAIVHFSHRPSAKSSLLALLAVFNVGAARAEHFDEDFALLLLRKGSTMLMCREQCCNSTPRCLENFPNSTLNAYQVVCLDGHSCWLQDAHGDAVAHIGWLSSRKQKRNAEDKASLCDIVLIMVTVKSVSMTRLALCQLTWPLLNGGGFNGWIGGLHLLTFLLGRNKEANARFIDTLICNCCGIV